MQKNLTITSFSLKVFNIDKIKWLLLTGDEIKVNFLLITAFSMSKENTEIHIKLTLYSYCMSNCWDRIVIGG
jgi:vancomycin permeability regulator SanA